MQHSRDVPGAAARHASLRPANAGAYCLRPSLHHAGVKHALMRSPLDRRRASGPASRSMSFPATSYRGVAYLRSAWLMLLPSINAED